MIANTFVSVHTNTRTQATEILNVTEDLGLHQLELSYILLENCVQLHEV